MLVLFRDDNGHGFTGYGGYGFVTSYTILTVHYCNRSNLALFNRLNLLNMLTSSKILTGYLNRVNSGAIVLPCRVLNPPQIGYKKHVDGKTIPAKIEMGKWNMPQSSNFVRGSYIRFSVDTSVIHRLTY